MEFGFNFLEASEKTASTLQKHDGTYEAEFGDTHFPDQHKSHKKQTSAKLKPGGSPDFLEEFFHPPTSSKYEVAETTVDGRFRNPKLTTTVWMVQKKPG